MSGKALFSRRGGTSDDSGDQRYDLIEFNDALGAVRKVGSNMTLDEARANVKARNVENSRKFYHLSARPVGAGDSKRDIELGRGTA